MNDSGFLKGPSNFWAKVHILTDTECWNWTAAITSAGYGSFGYEGKRANASRLAYVFSKGEIPPGLEVMHSCDNRRCCNPAHLSVGTRSQNMSDCSDRGRINRLRPWKLSQDQLRSICQEYAAGKSAKDIALKHSIHPTRVYQIAKQFGIRRGHAA